jgi:hypothetical protein
MTDEGPFAKAAKKKNDKNTDISTLYLRMKALKRIYLAIH